MAIKYKWLANKIIEQIPQYQRNGITKLPSENDLCKRYRVSRQTVRQSLSLLEEMGIIEKQQGRGSFFTGLDVNSERNRIDLIFPEDAENNFPNLIHDLQGLLISKGFQCNVSITGGDVLMERRILSQLLEQPPKAIIIYGTKSNCHNPNEDLYEALRQKCKIIFFQELYHFSKDFYAIHSAYHQGIEDAFLALIKDGHKNIGALFQMDTFSGQEKYRGFLNAKIHHETDFLATKETWLQNFDLERIRKGDTTHLEKLLREDLAQMTAIICQDDEIAYYLYRTYKKLKGALAPELTVIGFGNSFYSNSASTSFSSIGHVPQELCNTTVQYVLDLLKGISQPSKTIPCKLTLRISSQVDIL